MPVGTWKLLPEIDVIVISVWLTESSYGNNRNVWEVPVFPGRNQCIARREQKDHATRNVPDIGPIQACVVSNVYFNKKSSSVYDFIIEEPTASLFLAR